jgi:NTP pyrophosphatase (non-canonical NTP hydrolase)
MQMQDYLEKSGRTASKITEVRKDMFINDGILCAGLVEHMINAGVEADAVKRALFYGSTADSITERHKKAKMELDNLFSQCEAMGAVDPVRKLGDVRIDLIHAALGMISEAGEILEEVVKSYVDGRDLNIENLEEEAGDQLWYTALALRSILSTFEKAGEKNINKLTARYPDKFDSNKAENRNLQEEKIALQK